jgi:hypothetical protein
MAKKTIRLTESELISVIKKVLKEEKTLLNEGVYDNVKKIYDSCATEKRPATLKRPDLEKIAGDIFDAIDGVGTTLNKLKTAITASQSMVNFCAVSKLYNTLYGEDLLEAIDGDVNLDSEWRTYVYLPLYSIQQNQIEYDAAEKTTNTQTQTQTVQNVTVTGPLGCAKNEKGYQVRGGTGNNQWFSFPYGSGEIRGYVSGNKMYGKDGKTLQDANLQYIVNGVATKQAKATCFDGDDGEMTVGTWVDVG